jgi:hypothetical protein
MFPQVRSTAVNERRTRRGPNPWPLVPESEYSISRKVFPVLDDPWMCPKVSPSYCTVSLVGPEPPRKVLHHSKWPSLRACPMLPHEQCSMPAYRVRRTK